MLNHFPSVPSRLKLIQHNGSKWNDHKITAVVLFFDQSLGKFNSTIISLKCNVLMGNYESGRTCRYDIDYAPISRTLETFPSWHPQRPRPQNLQGIYSIYTMTKGQSKELEDIIGFLSVQLFRLRGEHFLHWNPWWLGSGLGASFSSRKVWVWGKVWHKHVEVFKFMKNL